MLRYLTVGATAACIFYMGGCLSDDGASRVVGDDCVMAVMQ